MHPLSFTMIEEEKIVKDPFDEPLEYKSHFPKMSEKQAQKYGVY